MKVLRAAVETAQAWILSVANGLDGREGPRVDRDEAIAYAALRAGLHAFRDRLLVDDAARLGSRLPLVVRGLYYEGWRPSAKRSETRDELLARIEHELRDLGLDPRSVERAVRDTIERGVAPTEVDSVRHLLPPRELESARAFGGSAIDETRPAFGGSAIAEGR